MLYNIIYAYTVLYCIQKYNTRLINTVFYSSSENLQNFNLEVFICWDRNKFLDI